MKLLLASDFQTDFGNVVYCETAIKEIEVSARGFEPDAIILAGDLKEQYNPADLRIVQFWLRAIRGLTATGYRVIILLGNHDRFSQSLKSKNWLNILRPAGAEIVTKPVVKWIGDGVAAFLPYTSSRKKEALWADRLFEDTKKLSSPKALIFHTDVTGAALNSGGRKAKGASLDTLHLAQYTACFGGHLHGYQRVTDNTWYIGSPFTHGWDEANQPKGHLQVVLGGPNAKMKPPKISVQQIRTFIPGWYDASFLEQRRKICKRCGGSGAVNIAYVASDNGIEHEGECGPCDCAPEDGALIRARVPVTTKKITEQLRNEEDRLNKLFPESKIRTLVVPKLVEEKADIELTGSSDQERVEQYVAATYPEKARFKATSAVAYLTKKLPERPYKPKPKTKAAKRRKRKAKAKAVKDARE